ncbi:neuroglian-like [Neodiprion virginianus]|uniref:neuroglian-like n=1 Tax=Neodiprion virginianus TaxID=2961670 RepID=UPI001EE6D959|nr:neuroglian-like [Neodiprion virginianus]
MERFTMASILLLVLITILQVYAQIQYPPKITKQPPTDEQFFQTAEPMVKGREFILECEAEGNPAPTYHWKKNGKHFEWQKYPIHISQRPGKGTLVISRPRDEDVGQYQCIAENALGTAISNSVFVRKAELNYPKDIQSVIVTANEGDPFKLTCQSPTGTPKPLIYWLKQYPNGSIALINDSRRTPDPDGNLWFTNVTTNDASDKVSYVCAVSSEFWAEYKFGPLVSLNVQRTRLPANNNTREPVQQYVTRKNEVALRGRTVKLYCIFGGTPVPQIIWKKNGEILETSERMTLRSHGKSLLIRHIVFEDEGTYTCDVSNGVGDPKSYSINLQIQSHPYFTVEPEIITARDNESVEFRCEAGGVPRPKIRWIHNGKPLQESTYNPRRKVSANSIVIENLVRNDTGNYGCNATNSLGYVYKDVSVNVLALEPEITHPPSNQTTVVGKTVRFTCRYLGGYKPRLEWRIGSWRLRGHKYRTLESGDLVISYVNRRDADPYTCHVFNRFSHVVASANLVVKNHTTIIEKPKNYESAVGSTAKFRCIAVSDSSLKVSIDWLRNGKQIDFDTESRVIKSIDNSLTVTEIRESDLGTYTCVASTELDETKAGATLMFQNVSKPPRLEVVNCRRNEADIHWVPAMGNNGVADILGYTIQFKTSFTPERWQIARENVSATAQIYTVPLSPWANYTFQVVAWNEIGKSLPSLPSKACTTPPDVPYKNPDDVRGTVTKEQKLVIRWTIMPEIEHNGPGFKYRVYFKLDTSGMNWTRLAVHIWTIEEIRITVQPADQRYKVKVAAMNYLGESRATPTEVVVDSAGDNGN